MVPRVAPDELANRKPYDFVKVSFELDWLIAAEAVNELKPMVSPIGKLTALPATNRIEAMDAVLNLQQIYEVIREEQSDSGQDRLVREFTLNHTSAEEVVEYLNTLLGIAPNENASRRGPMTPQQMEAMKRQAQMQAEMAKNAEGRYWIERVTLRPRIVFADGNQPDAAELERLHHAAHETCFIANSVLTEVRVEPAA